jgi:hypothetical protein
MLVGLGYISIHLPPPPPSNPPMLKRNFTTNKIKDKNCVVLNYFICHKKRTRINCAIAPSIYTLAYNQSVYTVQCCTTPSLPKGKNTNDTLPPHTTPPPPLQ